MSRKALLNLRMCRLVLSVNPNMSGAGPLSDYEEDTNLIVYFGIDVTGQEWRVQSMCVRNTVQHCSTL